MRPAVRFHSVGGGRSASLAPTGVDWPGCRTGPVSPPHPHKFEIWQRPAAVMCRRNWCWGRPARSSSRGAARVPAWLVGGRRVQAAPGRTQSVQGRALRILDADLATGAGLLGLFLAVKIVTKFVGVLPAASRYVRPHAVFTTLLMAPV